MGKTKKHRGDHKKGSKKKEPAPQRSAGEGSLPDSVQRSGKKARRTFVEARDDVLKKHKDGKRAEMAAFQALERAFEKIGDRWKRKDKRRTKDAENPTVAEPREVARPAEPEPVTAAPAEAAPARSTPGGSATAESPPAQPRRAAAKAPSTAPGDRVERAARVDTTVSRERAGAVGVSREASTTLLREAARRLEIRGRSRMTRDELLAALDEAGALTPGGSDTSRRSAPAGPQ